jgi:hypothetical protein
MKHFSKNEYEGLIDREMLKIHTDELKLELRDLEKQEASLLNDKDYNVAELLGYAADFLKDIGRKWCSLPFRQKLRLQWFVFPRGIVFENGLLRTAELSLVLKLKEKMDAEVFSIVPQRKKTKNTVSGISSPQGKEYLFETKEYWKEIADELINLHQTVYAPFENPDEEGLLVPSQAPEHGSRKPAA